MRFARELERVSRSAVDERDDDAEDGHCDELSQPGDRRLIPEAIPVNSSGAGFNAVEVMAGTVAARPREKTSSGGSTLIQ